MHSNLVSKSDAIKLLCQDAIYTAGSHVTGTVEISFPKVTEDGIESLRLKFRGVASTRIVRNNGWLSSVNSCSTLSLVHEDVDLWQKGTYPEADSHVLSIPFDIRLPKDTPGSLLAEDREKSATISYGLEVVANRPGLLHRNRRIGKIIAVLPLVSAEDVASSLPSTLAHGLTRSWNTTHQSSKMRRKLWETHSEVEGQLNLPAMSSMPINTPIPISLSIITTTKLMSQSDLSLDEVRSSKKLLFPAPPTQPGQLNLWLNSVVALRARDSSGKIETDGMPLGGFGRQSQAVTSSGVDVTEGEPQWISNHHGNKGRWLRQVHFKSNILLDCVPTIRLPPLITCEYELQVEVPFPGITNTLEWRVPIKVNSGIGETERSSSSPIPSDTNHNVAELPVIETSQSSQARCSLPVSHLPPTYFAGEYHEWDAPEKLNF